MSFIYRPTLLQLLLLAVSESRLGVGPETVATDAEQCNKRTPSLPPSLDIPDLNIYLSLRSSSLFVVTTILQTAVKQPIPLTF